MKILEPTRLPTIDLPPSIRRKMWRLPFLRSYLVVFFAYMTMYLIRKNFNVSQNELIEQYEAREDKESRFVYALDKIQPMLNIYTDGGRTWKEKGVTIDMLVEYKKEKVKQDRREKRKGLALGLKKLVIVNPFYYKVDESKKKNPVKLVASENAQKDLNNEIKHTLNFEF